MDHTLTHTVHFIDNFNFFWDHRHLFKRDGFCLNRPGVTLFASNMFYFLNRHCVPSDKDTRQERSKQKDKA